MDYPDDFKLFLASQSPRRHSLLTDLGVPFTVVESEAVERTAGLPVVELAKVNALAKVRGARLSDDTHAGAFVLGTDTLVSVGRRVMGKPSSADEAASMVCCLAGRKHRVVSGVALARLNGASATESDARVVVAAASTEVTFDKLDKAQVSAYVQSGEWKGKAGGYAVQGLAGLFVTGIRGEYSNVVGLPLHLMRGLFSELGFDLVRHTWSDAATGIIPELCRSTGRCGARSR